MILYPGAKFGPKIGLPSKAALFRFAFPRVLMRARRLWADLPILSMCKISLLLRSGPWAEANQTGPLGSHTAKDSEK